jgi:hypothetical protein
MARKLLTTALALAALALAPGPAAAKGIAAATVCGANGCEEVKDHALLMPLAEGGPPAAGPEQRGDFYTVRIEVDLEDVADSFRVLALPVQRMLRGADGTWMRMSNRTAVALAEAAQGLKVFPASRIPPDRRARVAEVVEPPAQRETRGAPWVAIVLGAAGAALAAALAVRRLRGSLRARAPES